MLSCYRDRDTKSMNIFRSDTAPYFFALAASGVGWFATSIASDLNARRIAVYSLVAEGDETRVVIENISRTSALDDAQFMFVCKDGRLACFEPGPQGPNGPPRHALHATPPLYLKDVAPAGSTEVLTLRVTLAPNSRLDLSLFPQAPGETPVIFYHVPEGEAPEPILFLPAGGPIPWFLENYLFVLILCLFATLGLLAVLIAIDFVGFIAQLFRKAPKDVETSKHHVTLRLDDGDAP